MEEGSIRHVLMDIKYLLHEATENNKPVLSSQKFSKESTFKKPNN